MKCEMRNSKETAHALDSAPASLTGVPNGLTRWHKQYSPMVLMMLEQCSSLVFTHRVLICVLF